MVTHTSGINNADRQFDINSLEEGRYNTDGEFIEFNPKSLKNPKQKINSSFQYHSNKAAYSSGLSLASRGDMASHVGAQSMASDYQYEIVPTTVPELQEDNDDDEHAGARTEFTIDSDGHVTPHNVRIINNGSKVIVKPKRIHQNPTTPEVLPKGFAPNNFWGRIKNKYLKEFLAEFLGTMILTMFGNGGAIQNNLGQQAKINQYYKYLKDTQGLSDANQVNLLKGITIITQGYSINVQLCWAAGVVCGYFAAGGSAISGAHMNIAVTLANYVFRGSPRWYMVIVYIVAQILGGYVSGYLLFGYYKRVTEEVYPDWRTNYVFLSSFVTTPIDYLSSGRQFMAEFFGTLLLVLGIFSMSDPYNNMSNDLFPVYLFIWVFALMAAFSLQTEAGINFGRDIGPRLAMWSLGASKEVLFSSHHHYFWVPFVAPATGGLAGGLMYDLLIFRGHESWVNRPIAESVNSLKRKWATFKRTITTGKIRDDEYEEKSSLVYGSDDGLHSIHSDYPKKNSLNDVQHIENSNLKDKSTSGSYGEKASNSGGDTFSLTDIPEEHHDDIEMTNVPGTRY